MPERENQLVDLFVRDLDQIALPARERWRPAPRRESPLIKASRLVLASAAIAAVAVLALLASAGLRTGENVAATATPSPTATTASPTAPVAATPSPAATPAAAGAISGLLTYPSEFIPPLRVYAVSVANPSVFFYVDTPQYGFGGIQEAQPRYTITGVAPGTYDVFAYGPAPGRGNRPIAVYSRFAVNCLKPSHDTQGPVPSGCPQDHTLVPVTVNPGETVERIDMLDWGCNMPGSTCPPEPR